MPCLNISTNVALDGIDTSSILSDATSTVANLLGKPESEVESKVLSLSTPPFLGNEQVIRGVVQTGTFRFVMIVLKGSVPIAFGGTEQPAAYGELVSIGGLAPDVNKKLCAAVSAILEAKLSVPKSRFFLKFYDTKGSFFGWNGSTF